MDELKVLSIRKFTSRTQTTSGSARGAKMPIRKEKDEVNACQPSSRDRAFQRATVAS